MSDNWALEQVRSQLFYSLLVLKPQSSEKWALEQVILQHLESQSSCPGNLTKN